MAQQRNLEQQCPYVSQPFTECISRSVTGRNIPAITRKCMGDFRACAIYQGRSPSAASEMFSNSGGMFKA